MERGYPRRIAGASLRFVDDDHAPGGEHAHVVAVSVDGEHRFSKVPAESILLIAGHGVAGDAHAGTTVQHRYLAAQDAAAPNLRQVHLLHRELLDEAAAHGIDVPPGGMGENILTRGLDVLGLPTGTRLRIGGDAVVRVTGLRNPCHQIEDYRPGLLALCYGEAEDGTRTRRAGIMGVVERSGQVRAGDTITVDPPPQPWRGLEVV